MAKMHNCQIQNSNYSLLTKTTGHTSSVRTGLAGNQLHKSEAENKERVK